VEEPSRSTQEVIAEVTRAKAMVEKAAEEPKVSDAAMLEEAIHILNEQRKFSPAVEQFSAPFVILTNSWD
jgi:hypothetical protein